MSPLEIRTLPLSELKPAPYNPRRVLSATSPAYRKLKASLSEFGLVEPLVWNELTGHVVGGHARLRVLNELGVTEVAVSVVRLTDAREKALNVVMFWILFLTWRLTPVKLYLRYDQSTDERHMERKAEPVAYSYIRFSSAEQAKGDSLRRQVEKTEEWCRKNKVKLDTKHTLRDLGVSGYRGDHRHKDNADRYALAGFMEMVRRGTVARGSRLIIEKFDRLTREAVRPALTLILNLIEAGIVIVQLEPETILDETADEYRLLTVIMELRRGNSESMAKSYRGGEAWEEKRVKARETNAPLTGRLPFWLKIVERQRVGKRIEGGRIVVDPVKEALVKRIFNMSLDGKGIYEITKKLNAEGIKHRKGHWATSHIAYLLANRSVLGEFQPMTGKHPDRKEAGAPITDYYPRVIDERTFNAVREGLDDRRRRKPGRPGKEKIYLFSGLLKDGRTGGGITYVTIGLKNSGVKLVSTQALAVMPGAKFTSFPASVFESCVLKAMKEIKVSDVMPQSDGKSVVSGVAGKLADVESRRDKIKARIKANPDSDTLYEVLKELEAEQKVLAAQVAEERQRLAAGTMEDSWGEVHSLAELAETADNEGRTRIRAAIRRVVESVWAVFFGQLNNEKFAVVQLNLKGGFTRVYVIHHKFKHKTRPAKTKWFHYKGVLDMRTQEDRKELVELLELGARAFAESK